MRPDEWVQFATLAYKKRVDELKGTLELYMKEIFKHYSFDDFISAEELANKHPERYYAFTMDLAQNMCNEIKRECTDAGAVIIWMKEDIELLLIRETAYDLAQQRRIPWEQVNATDIVKNAISSVEFKYGLQKLDCAWWYLQGALDTVKLKDYSDEVIPEGPSWMRNKSKNQQ